MKKDTKRQLLIGGLRVHPLERSYTIPSLPIGPRHAHSLILDAMRQCAPQVLDDLADAPYARFRELGEGAADVTSWEPGDVSWDSGNHAAMPDLRPLEAALRTWGERWHLTCLFKIALATMRVWSYRGEVSRDWAMGTYADIIYVTDEEARFTFTHPGWQPSGPYAGQTRPAARSAMIHAFEAALDDHLDRVWDVAKSRGANAKREPTKIELEHFEWFVSHQCLEEPTKDIAERASKARPEAIDDKTVQMAIKRTARFAGFECLRPFPRGRPEKKRTR